ncbi:polysaccharide biosynthesis protein [Curtanaerobium respiraculi]|uniref:polysaccharide biosynthesis protein n=1 Tax=Curtanaerobium respiraculi TaxID=2949669 RepID=UPI0024B3B202|nr:polysaccharide biosynthesis protein [Curtanaerobium respiraculi]
MQMMERRSRTMPAQGGKQHTVYSAVHFGNVLGSNGSIAPLFKHKVVDGGSVTVTDKRIIRYFMMIPEAVSLVLQSGYYAEGSEIFVLNMGDPMKIDDMVRKLIRFSGCGTQTGLYYCITVARVDSSFVLGVHNEPSVLCITDCRIQLRASQFLQITVASI